eukprot:UN03378
MWMFFFGFYSVSIVCCFFRGSLLYFLVIIFRLFLVFLTLLLFEEKTCFRCPFAELVFRSRRVVENPHLDALAWFCVPLSGCL